MSRKSVGTCLQHRQVVRLGISHPRFHQSHAEVAQLESTGLKSRRSVARNHPLGTKFLRAERAMAHRSSQEWTPACLVGDRRFKSGMGRQSNTNLASVEQYMSAPEAASLYVSRGCSASSTQAAPTGGVYAGSPCSPTLRAEVFGELSRPGCWSAPEGPNKKPRSGGHPKAQKTVSENCTAPDAAKRWASEGAK